MLIYDKFGTCFGNDLEKDTTNTLKFIPSRELTFDMHMAVLKMMFLLQRWNMFPGDPWSVNRLKGNNVGWIIYKFRMRLGVYVNAKLS